MFRLTYEMLITENSIKFVVLKIKSYVSKSKVIFFDFIGHKKIALVISDADKYSLVPF